MTKEEVERYNKQKLQNWENKDLSFLKIGKKP